MVNRLAVSLRTMSSFFSRHHLGRSSVATGLSAGSLQFPKLVHTLRGIVKTCCIGFVHRHHGAGSSPAGSREQDCDPLVSAISGEPLVPAKRNK